MATKYDYSRPLNIDHAEDVETAIWFSVVNYMHHQLGWMLDDCEDRLRKELKREIPAGTFNHLQRIYQWNFTEASVLDVGAGQGGTVLEALHRGADAKGIEPGEEFCQIGKMRLESAGFDPNAFILAGGEEIPFPDNHFDYVISLQVLEHVENPKAILKEIYRVLKPSGECYISCENYLSFREQHYRVPWLPLLPKFLGSIYLRLIARDPHFLKNYVYYTTYPQIWRLCRKAGFKNITYDRVIEYRINQNKTGWMNKVIKQIARKEDSLGRIFLKNLLHLRYFFDVGVRVVLKKSSAES